MPRRSSKWSFPSLQNLLRIWLSSTTITAFMRTRTSYTKYGYLNRGSLTALAVVCGDPGRGQGLEAWKHPEFSRAIFDDQRRTLQKANCKRLKILDVIRHVEIYGRGRKVNNENKDLIQSFSKCVLQKSPTYSISQYFLTLGVSKSKRFQQKRW